MVRQPFVAAEQVVTTARVALDIILHAHVWGFEALRKITLSPEADLDGPAPEEES